MSPNDAELAVLLADITGSTPLYENVGDAAALAQIVRCLDRLRSITGEAGGVTIRSKGDDVLCTFAEPAAALGAVRCMLAEHSSGALAIHAGIHFGPVLHARDDIFGDTVNVAARLASLANAGEVLASRGFVERLRAEDAHGLRVLDRISFKGKAAGIEVYTLRAEDAWPRTEVAFGPGALPTQIRRRQGVPEVAVTLRHRGTARRCAEGTRVSIGRASDCDLVIGRPWVSRRHATLVVQRGKVQLGDTSSAGTYVLLHDGSEVFARRETVLLPSSGLISPAVRPSDEAAEVIHYDLVRVHSDG